LTYYWSPMPLLRRSDLIKLASKPGHEKAIKVQAGLSKLFYENAPELVAVLEKVNVPIDLLNKALAEQAEHKQDAPTVARAFLKAHPDVWHEWVDAAAAQKIEASL